MTGIQTGLLGYIHTNAPDALRMPPAYYSDYYRAPWATNKSSEDRHKIISQDIGNSLKGRKSGHKALLNKVGNPLVANSCVF